MYERTEADILACAPIKVRLGKTDHDVPVLTILKARKWREQFVEELKTISGALGAETQGADDAFFGGLAAGWLQFPEKIADLVFAYAGESLKREEIEETATEEELVAAFAQITKVAFPFLRQLAAVNQVLGTAATLSQSRKSVN